VAIRIPSLHEIAKQYEEKTHIFKDWHFDFAKSSVYDTTLNRKIEGNDVQVDYDEQAIRNSLRNLFNTKPGQRFLFPKYGLDLYQFLFEPITSGNARLIGEKIKRSIELYEPRIRLVTCDITPRADDNTYEIAVIVQLPAFRTTTTISSTLDVKKQTFIFLETSRNR
jgi:phage baseplate assembly protein W